MNKLIISLFLVLLFISYGVSGQDIDFTFQNAQIVNDGANDFYEVDIYIASSVDFKLGSGQLYLNYNTAAFGNNVSGSGNLTYSHGTLGGSYILDEFFGGLVPIYNSFVQNDNTTSRFSVSFQQVISGDAFAVNVTSTPQPLMRLRVQYVDAAQDPMLCFEFGSAFDDQFFTACGGTPPFADCINFPGTQLTNDTFDCTGAALNCAAITSWNGTAWDNGIPDAVTAAIINGDYDTAINGDINACELTVSSGVTLDIRAGGFINIENNITVDGSLLVEHQGSVVQVSDMATVTKNGTINVGLTTPVLSRRHFSILGSPMSAETREGVFEDAFLVLSSDSSVFVPSTDVDDAITNDATNFIDANANLWSPYSGMLNVGVGYLMRPLIWSSPEPPQAFSYTYELGTLNNGVVSIPVMDTGNSGAFGTPYMVSNPYASAISADDFIMANTLVGDVYFWEHLTLPSPDLPGPYAYNHDMGDVSIYNLSGGVAAANDMVGTTEPNGIISTGQGFAVRVAGTGTVGFNNSMRRTTGNTTLRNSTASLDRIWLRLTNAQYELGSTSLLAFRAEGTSGMDFGYDSNRIANVISLYSQLNDGSQQLSIQTREVFDIEHKVPFGFSSHIEEELDYRISIDAIEGDNITAEGVTVYLVDNFLNVVTNLSEGDYTFRSNKGNFPGRFTVKFTNENILSVGDNSTPESIALYPSPTEGLFTILHTGFELSKIRVSDINGRVIRQLLHPDIFSTQPRQQVDITDLASGVYFVHLTTADQQTVVKRIIKE